MSDVAAVARELRECSSVLISVHKNPDGDALGAQLGLMLALEKLGKQVSSHNLDPVPEIYRFLPGQSRITSGNSVKGTYDAFVVLDADPPRTGLLNGIPPARVQINIDHHVTNMSEWPLTWLDPKATATGEMIYRLLGELGVSLDGDIACCLYTAIFTDTGSFRYANTTPESMRIAATLLDAGADTWIVTENVYESFAFRRIQLLGKVLGEIERSADGRVAWVVVTNELYQQTGTTAEDTDNFVNFVRSVQGVEVAVLFRQTGPEQYKISLRSKGRVNLSALAKTLGGGGHENAAGGVLDGAFSQVRDKVIGAVTRVIADRFGTTAPSTP